MGSGYPPAALIQTSPTPLRPALPDCTRLSKHLPGFLEGTTKSFAIKTKPWRVAAPVLTAKLLAVFHGKPVRAPD